MPKIAYASTRLNDRTLTTINKANEIIAEYTRKGFNLTLRQLYYQFVARDLIPNNLREYSKLGKAISSGRMCGLIDWYAITDRTRGLASVPHWDSPTKIIDSVAKQYRVDKWDTQPRRVEVWIEKDAAAGIVEGVCRELDVPFFSCRGYSSLSEMWIGAMRLKKHAENGQTPLILHIGDHDPSGKDMTRDILDRMATFMGGVEIDRLALNFDQIEQYNPPSNPTKFNDPRAASYIAEFGHESWELDALDPVILVTLIRDAVEGVRDQEAWAKRVEEEQMQRALLAKTSRNWDDVVDRLNDTDDDPPEDEDQ